MIYKFPSKLKESRILRSKIIPPFVTLLGVILTLETLVKKKIIQDYFLPAPSDILRALGSDWESLSQATLSTFTSAFLGLGLSFLIGTLLALLFSVSDFVRRAVYPYAVFFQTVPVISIAPLLVIWFGFGQPTVIAASFIVSVFPMIANVLLGLQSTDPQLVELFKLYHASSWSLFLKLKLPYALPQVFAGLRIAAGLSVVGAIVGEFIAGGGLGGVVDAARAQQRVDLVFASILISSLIGLILVGIINYLSWLSLRRWHISEQ